VPDYLLIYDRRAGNIVRHRQYDDGQVALDARFEAEREFRGQPDIEVVVLGADSWDALKRTHGRYFYTVGELARIALEQLDELQRKRKLRGPLHSH
jgi:hypothetical protein